MSGTKLFDTMGHMTRRSFVSAAALASGAATLAGLTACEAGSPTDTTSATETAPETSSDASGETPTVYFTHAVEPDALQAVFDAIGSGLTGKIGVKLSTGEPGGNHYLKADLISGLIHAVNGTIVECNTAYDGPRATTKEHYQVAADHGFTGIADFQIMDEDGSASLPVEGGLHLKEDLVGTHFVDYDGFLVLSHFKGHMMAGFGGAIKNMAIGMASSEGKFLIHSAGKTRTEWDDAPTPEFLEAMADASKAVLAAQPNMLFVNVMNNLSIDCDCDPNPAAPKMADIGILASADPVALDQACVDLIYASDDDSADLIERMESLDGPHVLEAAESLGVGSRKYELVEIA